MYTVADAVCVCAREHVYTFGTHIYETIITAIMMMVVVKMITLIVFVLIKSFTNNKV